MVRSLPPPLPAVLPQHSPAFCRRTQDITTVYQKERHEFGRPVNTFAPTDAAVLDEFLPEKAEFAHIERNPTILDVQAIPQMSETYVRGSPSTAPRQSPPHLSILTRMFFSRLRPLQVNTETVMYKPQGMLHLEGGWPKEVDPTEKEQTQRYKKKVEKDDDYIRQVKTLASTIEGDIKQNYSIDIYQEYFSGESATDYSSEPPSAKTLAVFKDPGETKRSACSISWHPDMGRKIAVAFAIMQFQDERQKASNMDSYIWDVNNPNTPEITLTPPSPLCCLEYNPKDPHLLVGGSYNGLVTCYDTRVGYTPKDVSIIEKSHRDPVYKITWLPGKTPFECASTSTDGQVLWWDVRKLAEPIEGLWVEEKTEEKQRVGGTSLEYSGAGGKFMIGSEQGKIAACSRKGKTPADKIGNIWEAHCGPVYALQRNPWFPKFYLTVGDWSVKVWNEEIRSPIMTSKFFRSYVLDAAWSPTRPGVFVTTKMDGTLDVWDIFYKQHDPTLSLQVDADGLKTVRFQEQGALVATGSVDGSVYMLELSEGLSTIQNNEKPAVMNMLERESKREKNLEARAKELRAKEKRAAEAASAVPVEKAPWEGTGKSIEEKFWECVGGRVE